MLIISVTDCQRYVAPRDGLSLFNPDADLTIQAKPDRMCLEAQQFLGHWLRIETLDFCWEAAIAKQLSLQMRWRLFGRLLKAGSLRVRRSSTLFTEHLTLWV